MSAQKKIFIVASLIILIVYAVCYLAVSYCNYINVKSDEQIRRFNASYLDKGEHQI